MYNSGRGYRLEVAKDGAESGGEMTKRCDLKCRNAAITESANVDSAIISGSHILICRSGPMLEPNGAP